jgi:hypothetical protein
MIRFISTAISLMLSSCASYHSGLITSPISKQHSNQYEYVDVALGYSKATYFLGMGGFEQRMPVSQAKSNLYRYNELSANQTFENITVDFITTFYGPFRKVETILMADIVDWGSDLHVNFSDSFKNFHESRKINSKDFLQINERIIFIDKSGVARNGRILELKEESSRIFFLNTAGNNQIKSIQNINIFKVSKVEELQQLFNINLGDRVNAVFKDYYGNWRTADNVEVIGFNRNSVLINYNGRYYPTRLGGIKKN